MGFSVFVYTFGFLKGIFQRVKDIFYCTNLQLFEDIITSFKTIFESYKDFFDVDVFINNSIIDMDVLRQVQSRKYLGIFQVESQDNHCKFEKLVSTI